MTTDAYHASRLALLSQEQLHQGQSLGELRHALTLALRRIEWLEQEMATLKAAWVASRIEGAECSASTNS